MRAAGATEACGRAVSRLRFEALAACAVVAIGATLRASAQTSCGGVPQPALADAAELCQGAPSAPDLVGDTAEGLAASSAETAEQTSPGKATARPPDFRHRSRLTGDWRGLRNWVEDRGISIEPVWVGNGFDNFRGGLRRGTTGAMAPQLTVTADLEKAVGLHGGKFHISVASHEGHNPSEVLVGDIQLMNRFGSGPFVQVYELWYEQELLGNSLRAAGGKMDANSQFSVINNGLSFLNSATQVSPTVQGFPTYPFPSLGLTLFYTPPDPFFASFAIYAVGRDDRFLVFYGHPESLQPTLHGKLFIGETGLNWSGMEQLKSDRNLRLGFWRNTGAFTRFDGGTEQGARGFYAILDEVLWRPARDESGARGLRTFLEYGYTSCAVAPVCRHYGAGVSWKGPFTRRKKDEAGFAAEYAHLSPGLQTPHRYELALEAFYRIEVAPWVIVQPDFQFIVHPSGQYPSAAVGTLFVQFNF